MWYSAILWRASFKHANWLIPALVIALSTRQAPAVTINLVYDPTGNSSDVPDVDPNGNMLTDLIEYVASVYEDIIEDQHTITIRYRYQADVNFTNGSFAITETELPNGGGRTTEGLLRIRRTPNNDPTRFFYYDPTPSDDAEFDMVPWLYDYGPNRLTTMQKNDRFTGSVPALFEVGYRGEPRAGTPCDNANCTDLLTILFHEVGHGMGLGSEEEDSDSLLLNETEIEPGDTTGDYDVDPQLVGGNALGIKVRGMGNKNARSHPFGGGSSNFAVMNSNTPQVRRRPSATDILAMASVANWTDLDLPRKDFLTGNSWHIGGNWLGGAMPGFGDDVFLRHGGSVFLAGPGRAKDLLVDEGSVLITGSNVLRALSTVTIGNLGSGEVIVGGLFGPVSSPTFQADQVVVNPTGTLRLLGNTASGEEAVVMGGEVVLAGGRILVNEQGAGRIDSSIQVASNSNVTIDSGSQLNLNGDITGTANLTKTGSGTLVLAGNNEGWTGDLIIDRGRVNTAPGNSLGNATTVDLRSALGIIDFAPAGHVQVFGGLEGDGTVLLGSDDIWFGANNTDTVFTGPIIPPLSGVGGGFVKLGTGTTTFTDDALALNVARASSREGGTLVFSGNTFVSTALLEATSGSTVRIEGDAHVVAFASDFSDPGILELVGGTFETTVFDGVLLNQGGTFSPGTPDDSTRVLSISDNFNNSADSTLQIDIGGLTPGDHDQLSLPIGPPGTGKSAGLGGTLDINLVGGFLPNLGNTFTIAKARSVSFSGVLNAPIFDGMTFDLMIANVGSNEMHAILHVIEAPLLPGDYNQDGVVDAADYTVWRDNLGAPAGALPNDTDGGPIGQAQYQTWVANFGATASTAMASGAVPEPTNVVGLCLAMALIVSARRDVFSRR